MAIARIQQKDSGTTSASGGRTSRTLTWNSTPTQGNFMVACFAFHTLNSTTAPTFQTVTGPSGWTEVCREEWQEPWYANNSTHIKVYYKIAGASESTTVGVTVSHAMEIAAWAAEYSGVDTSDPIDKTSVASGFNYSGSNHAAYVCSDLPDHQNGLCLYWFAYAANDGGTQTHTINLQHHAVTATAVGSNPSLDDDSSSTGNSRIGLSGWESIQTSGTEESLCADGQMTISTGGAAGSMGAGLLIKASGATAVSNKAYWTPESIVSIKARKYNTSGSSTSQSHTFAETSTSGNLLTFWLIINHATSVPTITSSGWTNSGGFQLGSLGCYLYYKTSAGDSSIAWTLSIAATSNHLSTEWMDTNAISEVLGLQDSGSDHDSHRRGQAAVLSGVPYGSCTGRSWLGSRDLTASANGTILWLFVSRSSYTGSHARAHLHDDGTNLGDYTSCIGGNSSTPIFSFYWGVTEGGTKAKMHRYGCPFPGGSNFGGTVNIHAAGFKVRESSSGGNKWGWTA